MGVSRSLACRVYMIFVGIGWLAKLSCWYVLRSPPRQMEGKHKGKKQILPFSLTRVRKVEDTERFAHLPPE